MLNIVFMGTPDFAKDSLEALYNAGHNILGVVTNVDKPQGRGMKLTYTPVKEFAIQKNLKVYQPEKVRKNEGFINEIKNLNPDLLCVVAYGKILPKEILEIPKLGAINLHGSLLPKYRGAAPIQWAVLNGEKTTGITTMYMDVGMDTGDMILKRKTAIAENETTGELWERLSKIGAELLVETIKKIENGTAPRIKQSDEFTLAPMLDKAMAKIDWENKTSNEIKNLIRGLNPIIGAYSLLNNKKIKFWKANAISHEKFIEEFKEFEEHKNRVKKIEPGTVLYSDEKKGLYIKTIDGVISVLEIQGENSRKMLINEFLRGNEITAGQIFE